MPRGFSVVAIVAAYNEADIIDTSVRDLIDQGIAVYLLDDGSTDDTAAIVEPYVGRGVLGIERLRAPEAAGSGEFALKHIVKRKAQLAAELDADWFINHDADEFRESPWGDVPLKEAIRRVDALEYNAIDFASLDFRPTDDCDHVGEDVRAAFQFYSESADYDRIQIRCWKKTPCVELESTGGHDTRFDGRKVFPVRFLLRHYPIRGQTHGERKVFVERRPRYAEQERTLGWHVQYDDVAEGTSFVHDPSALKRYDPVGVRIDLSLRHRGVEALEQSLVGLQAEHDAARAELAARSNDVERLQDELKIKSAESLARGQALERMNVEIDDIRSQLTSTTGELTEARAQLAHHASALAAHRDEIAGLTNALEQRKVEVANLEAGIADFMKQLDAFRRSLSWRVTAPARAVLRLLRGR